MKEKPVFVQSDDPDQRRNSSFIVHGLYQEINSCLHVVLGQNLLFKIKEESKDQDPVNPIPHLMGK